MDLESTVDELARPLLRYSMAKTGDPAAAEDIAQVALTALVARWRHHGPPESPAAFAFSIARRRANRSRIRQSLLRPLELLQEVTARDPDVEQQAIDRDRLAVVRSELRRLPPAEREAITMLFAGGLSYVDAATAPGIATATLRMRVHRARTGAACLRRFVPRLGAGAPRRWLGAEDQAGGGRHLADRLRR